MRYDDLALCQRARDVWGGISWKPLEIETWVQRTTNGKWTTASPMVTWPMTSRNRDMFGAIISKMAGDSDLVTMEHLKSGHLGIEWSRDCWRHMTLKSQGRDPDMFSLLCLVKGTLSPFWLHDYMITWCPLCRKWHEIATWWQRSVYRKWLPGTVTSRDPQRSRSWPNMLRAQYLGNVWR